MQTKMNSTNYQIYFSLHHTKDHVYDRTGESTIRTLLKTGYKNLRTGTEAKFRPFLEALTKANSAVINR